MLETSSEWVCGRHWTLAPRRLRLLHREAKRAIQKYRVRHFKASRLGWAKGKLARLLVAAVRRENRRWEAIKAAIDLALREGAEEALTRRGRAKRDIPASRHDVRFEAAFQKLRGGR